jgi:hypothetical protein
METKYFLVGALATTSFVAALFFLRFWRQTRDSFFLLFAVAFAVDAVARFASAVLRATADDMPLFYLPRLLTFGIIVLAIVRKNVPPPRKPPC